MSIFIDNKYTRWYYLIVQHARYSNDLKSDCEKHHIVPKNMGGSDLAENLVRLTTRQHFVCHLLLTRMVLGQNRNKAWRGLRAMALMDAHGARTFRVTSRLFEQLRRINHLPDTIEQRERKSAAQLARKYKHTEKTKAKMRLSFEKRNGKPAARVMTVPKPRWRVISPAGQRFNILLLETFCHEMNLHCPSLVTTVKTRKPVPEMQRKRRDTSLARKNVIGWRLEKLH